ncbi:metallophosphoesterase family protein [Roseovarius sp. 2305UL8-3]|uniref:metallophosphoesterase family protein n=1 Tax=Roseovarius conchicola TaxID=3121636 RepID=UPI003526F83A
MKQCDLGVLDGPVLIFGGPYSNLQATQAVLDKAAKQGIAPSNVICTGDVVAYCGQPVETIDAIRSFGCAVVAGNCEKQLAAYEDNCGCGFEVGTTCDLLSAGWYAHASATVGDEDRQWMAELPDLIRFSHQGQQMAVIHGGVRDVSRFVWPSDAHTVFNEEISEIQKVVPQTSCVFAGHSGSPFQRDIENIRWVNAGVVGMPSHDGTPDTRYVVLHDDEVTIHTLSYDKDAAQAAMQAVGLRQGYDRALVTGYWPSEDVLPEALRARG